MKAWLLWFLICGVILLADGLIAGGAAVHSPRFDGQSIVMSLLLTAGVLVIITTIIVICEWLQECDRVRR